MCVYVLCIYIYMYLPRHDPGLDLPRPDPDLDLLRRSPDSDLPRRGPDLDLQIYNYIKG